MYHQIVVLDLGVCTPLLNIPGTHFFVPPALNVVLVVELWSQFIIVIVVELSWGNMQKNGIWHELLSRMRSVLEVEEACICVVRQSGSMGKEPTSPTCTNNKIPSGMPVHIM
jgi:hypothetical protein